MTIYSKIYFYGGAANEKNASIPANNIQTQWNAANGAVMYQGKEYKNVQFVILYEVVPEERAALLAKNNTGENFDPQMNFARIESGKENKDLNNAFDPDRNTKGGNSFFFLAEDIVEGNTSQAHEYGHGLGLTIHDNEVGLNYDPTIERAQGQPGIMTTLHSLVEGAYREMERPRRLYMIKLGDLLK